MAAGIIEVVNQCGTFSYPEQWDTTQPLGLFHLPSWCSSPCWLKVNVDGALLHSNCGGFSLIVRNDKGDPVRAPGWGIEHWDNAQVELQAILRINMVLQGWMFDSAGIIVEGDNLSVIKFMQEYVEKKRWTAQPLLGEDLNWVHMLHKVLFQHTP
ncbi:hypothetical protein IEQ34_008147 [Dendrobium chrysotoxum]|uniref:RNase H type-1 domain-containing protein n=1 Tax=Dendrobium chrysotoxum TaxID=161865 RepID=A0AAV7H7T0_DENCH|nr:hypothetical protein IEQ34_008147 [Dendrobium chrysotoxum]